MRTLLALGFLAISPATALAAATPWQDVAPNVRLRLISSDMRTPDGATLVGLEIDMPLGYRTYWRLPGETGIPTEIDTTGSTGIADLAIRWPYPAPEFSNGYLDYVYNGPTVLPIVLQAGAGEALLQAAVVMGVCSDVCVPVRARFSLPLTFAAADPGETIRLKQALALTPIAWNRQASPFTTVEFDPSLQGLRLVLADAAIDPASIIASTSDATVIFDAPQKSPDGRSILLAVRGKPRNADWQQMPIQLTFMTAMGSFEVSAPVTVTAP
jgi:DsbC/DsbD-like thiol-disulfide interchange protein